MKQNDQEWTVVEKPKWAWLAALRGTRKYKDLWWLLVVREVKAQYQQTLLGLGWAILLPLVNALVLALLFQRVSSFNTDQDPMSYWLYCYAGLIPFTYFSQSLQWSSNLLISYKHIFAKVYFPRIFIPLVPLASKLLDYMVSSLLLFLCLLVIQPSQIDFLLLPKWIFASVMLAYCTSGLSIWAAALSANYRDVKFALTFLLQLLMLLTPIFWKVEMLSPVMQANAGFYPMVTVLELFRWALLGTPLHYPYLWQSFLVASILLVSGIAWFSRKEPSMADSL